MVNENWCKLEKTSWVWNSLKKILTNAHPIAIAVHSNYLSDEKRSELMLLSWLSIIYMNHKEVQHYKLHFSCVCKEGTVVKNSSVPWSVAKTPAKRFKGLVLSSFAMIATT